MLAIASLRPDRNTTIPLEILRKHEFWDIIEEIHKMVVGTIRNLVQNVSKQLLKSPEQQINKVSGGLLSFMSRHTLPSLDF